MHCDVSGFTAMSESLAQVGKEGAELMTGVLNRFFERMLGIAERWDGVQMKFGGDSLLLYFGHQDHAAHAVACGIEMQSAMRDFSRITVGDRVYKLRMRAGVHTGSFFSASVGQPDGTLHYLLLGDDVNRACRMEMAGTPRAVVASRDDGSARGSSSVLRNVARRLARQID
jgi:class 3 adenylate cyclase